jgi:N-acetyl-gamma-glutamyl-phosphate reductase
LPRDKKICDLSADFRLTDPAIYAEWLRPSAPGPRPPAEAVYGLTETGAGQGGEGASGGQSRLLSDHRAVAPDSAAGKGADRSRRHRHRFQVRGFPARVRAAKEGSLFAEVAEGMHAYGVASHRHAPEIDQGLSAAAGRPVIASFTPHLIPMNRGMLSTIYVNLAGAAAADLHAALAARYAGEPFVKLLPFGQTPHTRHVRGSNLALIGVAADRRPNAAILTCAIDNLVKGASGQAVQNMNAMLGFDETLGLAQAPMFP